MWDLITQNPTIASGLGGMLLGLIKAELINKHELRVGDQKTRRIELNKEYKDIEVARHFNNKGAIVNRTLITVGLLFVIIFMTMASVYSHVPYTVVYSQHVGWLGRFWYGPVRMMFKTVYGIVDQPWIHIGLISIISFYFGKQRQ